MTFSISESFVRKPSYHCQSIGVYHASTGWLREQPLLDSRNHGLDAKLFVCFETLRAPHVHAMLKIHAPYTPNSFIPSFLRSLARSLARSFLCSLNHSFVRPFLRLLLPCFPSFVHSFIHAFISLHFISLHFVLFHFISCHLLSFHFVQTHCI